MDLMLWEKPEFTLACPPFGEITARICRKVTYEKILMFLRGNGNVNFKKIFEEICPDKNSNLLTVTGAFIFFGEYVKAVEEYCENHKEYFRVPQRVDFEDEREEIALPMASCGMHIIHDYSGLDFFEINELDILDYRLLLADGVKMAILSGADGKGRERLRECKEYMFGESSIFS